MKRSNSALARHIEFTVGGQVWIARLRQKYLIARLYQCNEDFPDESSPAIYSEAGYTQKEAEENLLLLLKFLAKNLLSDEYDFED